MSEEIKTPLQKEVLQEISIIFVVNGSENQVKVPLGITILEAARMHDIDLEGACEGSLACSTCHVILDKDFYNKLKKPQEEEEDMLDLAFGLTDTSRLGCQIVLTKDLEGMRIIVPSVTRNI